MSDHEALVRRFLELLRLEQPNIDATPGSSVGRTVSRLLAMSPMEIQELVSSGGLDDLESQMFTDTSPAKLVDFADREPLKLNLRSSVLPSTEN